MRQHALRYPRFLFFCSKVGVFGGFSSSHCVSMKFPICSPMCSRQLLTLSHILCPKDTSSTFCNLYNQPKNEMITTYLFWDFPKLDFFWVIGQSKMPITKENLKNFGGPYQGFVFNSKMPITKENLKNFGGPYQGFVFNFAM